MTTTTLSESDQTVAAASANAFYRRTVAVALIVVIAGFAIASFLIGRHTASASPISQPVHHAATHVSVAVPVGCRVAVPC